MSKNKMVKATALKAFDSGGKEYLPGEVEVPAESVEKLVQRGLISSDGIEAAPETSTQGIATHSDELQRAIAERDQAIRERDEARAEVQSLRAGNGGASTQVEPKEFPESLEEVLDKKVARVLLDAGFDSPAKLAAAKDEELLALSFVGKHTVEKIRENLKREG